MWIAVLLGTGNTTAMHSLGIWPINCSSGFLRIFLQVTHFPLNVSPCAMYPHNPETLSRFLKKIFVSATCSLFMKVIKE